MRFRIVPGDFSGYYLYVEKEMEFEYVCLTLTKFGAKLKARRIVRKNKKAEEFEL